MLAHHRFRWSNILSAWDTETEAPGFPWSPPWPLLPGDNPLAFAGQTPQKLNDKSSAWGIGLPHKGAAQGGS